MNAASAGLVEGKEENGVVELKCQGDVYFTGDVAEAITLLDLMEPHMKSRGHFIFRYKTAVLRSYDVKDSVRVLRKIVTRT
jgi:hypothetical protein